MPQTTIYISHQTPFSLNGIDASLNALGLYSNPKEAKKAREYEQKAEEEKKRQLTLNQSNDLLLKYLTLEAERIRRENTRLNEEAQRHLLNEEDARMEIQSQKNSNQEHQLMIQKLNGYDQTLSDGQKRQVNCESRGQQITNEVTNFKNQEAGWIQINKAAKTDLTAIQEFQGPRTDVILDNAEAKLDEHKNKLDDEEKQSNDVHAKLEAVRVEVEKYLNDLELANEQWTIRGNAYQQLRQDAKQNHENQHQLWKAAGDRAQVRRNIVSIEARATESRRIAQERGLEVSQIPGVDLTILQQQEKSRIEADERAKIQQVGRRTEDAEFESEVEGWTLQDIAYNEFVSREDVLLENYRLERRRLTQLTEFYTEQLNVIASIVTRQRQVTEER